MGWIITLKNDLLSLFGEGLSGKDLILLAGGLFLIYKATKEIHHKLEGRDPEVWSAARWGRDAVVTLFSARNISMSTVPARSGEIWHLITDPSTLAALTPLVRSIEASGSQWQWTLEGIDKLGLNVDAVFTERMEFTEGRQIVFSHDPPSERRESAGLEGIYDLTPVDNEATELKVDLTLSVDLPLPGLSRLAVEGVMQSMMRTTGQMFASNLYERLGLDPSTVAITELAVPQSRAEGRP